MSFTWNLSVRARAGAFTEPGPREKQSDPLPQRPARLPAGTAAGPATLSPREAPAPATVPTRAGRLAPRRPSGLSTSPADDPGAPDEAWLADVIGLPPAHRIAFREAARIDRTVIVLRALGGCCRGLLDEGYDTKGFRIHGKSCDWGPMAGFVLRDPRLSKLGLAQAAVNRRSHLESLEDPDGAGWKAGVTPLRISRRRVAWLVATRRIEVRAAGDRLEGIADHAGVRFAYALVPEPNGLYGVCFDHARGDAPWDQETGTTPRPVHPAGPHLEPMLALTNPEGHDGLAPGSATHLRAVTGDCDLFAVWPERDSAWAVGNGAAAPLAVNAKLGVIDDAIHHVAQRVNSMSLQQIVWHSAETLRPGVAEVSLPLVAFLPDGGCVALRTVADLRDFVRRARQTCEVGLSRAWACEPTGSHPDRLGAAFAADVRPRGEAIGAPRWYGA